MSTSVEQKRIKIGNLQEDSGSHQQKTLFDDHFVCFVFQKVINIFEYLIRKTFCQIN